MYIAAKRNDDGSWEAIALFTNSIIAREWLSQQALKARHWMHLFRADGVEVRTTSKPASWMQQRG